MLCNQVEWQKDEKGQYQMVNVPDTNFEIQVDLVVLAMGFDSVRPRRACGCLGLNYNGRSNIAVDAQHMTSVDGVFAAGDASVARRWWCGPFQEGRETAKGIDAYLIGLLWRTRSNRHRLTA